MFERSWYAITETCLAFTVFRDDFSPKFVTMFTFLLFLKCFHWLAEDRVDYVNTKKKPTNLKLFLFFILTNLIEDGTESNNQRVISSSNCLLDRNLDDSRFEFHIHCLQSHTSQRCFSSTSFWFRSKTLK